jgi:hypothetical protein
MSGRQRGEDGYVMVVTVTVVAILTSLLGLVLTQALHNHTATTFDARRSRALGVAEAGISWAMAVLEETPSAAIVTDRAVPVADGTGGTGMAAVTVRRGTPTVPSRPGYYTILSTGQVAGSSGPTRTVRVVLGPAASFTYALYADSSLTLEQNSCIVGGVYAQGDVFFDGNTTIAGTAKARGSLLSAHGVIRQFGGATSPKCPATVECEAVDSSRDIHGDVLAGGGTLSPCLDAPAGAVSAATQGFNLGGASVGGRVCNDPPPSTMPTYTFDPELYATVSYFGRPPGYGEPTATAVSSANAALAAANAAVWPRRAVLVHRLRRIGLEALLRMPPPEAPGFFEVFFALPEQHRWTYLTGRSDLRGTAATLGSLFMQADWRLRRRLVGPALLPPATLRR